MKVAEKQLPGRVSVRLWGQAFHFCTRLGRMEHSSVRWRASPEEGVGLLRSVCQSSLWEKSHLSILKVAWIYLSVLITQDTGALGSANCGPFSPISPSAPSGCNIFLEKSLFQTIFNFDFLMKLYDELKCIEKKHGHLENNGVWSESSTMSL